MEKCEEVIVHNELCDEIKDKMLDDDQYIDLAELFKVFGDYTRIKILSALEHKELCVCDISLILNMSISAISHQLRILRQSKLVKSRKSGKEVFYSLDDEHVSLIIDCGLSHINE